MFFRSGLQSTHCSTVRVRVGAEVAPATLEEGGETKTRSNFYASTWGEKVINNWGIIGVEIFGL